MVDDQALGADRSVLALELHLGARKLAGRHRDKFVAGDVHGGATLNSPRQGMRDFRQGFPAFWTGEVGPYRLERLVKGQAIAIQKGLETHRERAAPHRLRRRAPFAP